MVDRPARIEARAEIARLHAAGYGTQTIARTLNVRGVPTPSGRGVWWSDTVRRQLDPDSWAAYMRGYRDRQRSSWQARRPPPR